MRNKTKMLLVPTAALFLVAGIVWLVHARQHRAIALQPIDLAKAISAEIRAADSAPEAWRMAKAVSSMFWDSYEVRVVNGRAFSGLPFYRPPTTAEKVSQLTDDDDIRIEIIDAGENNGEVQQAAGHVR